MKPALHLPIPNGATHFNPVYVRKFMKKSSNEDIFLFNEENGVWEPFGIVASLDTSYEQKSPLYYTRKQEQKKRQMDIDRFIASYELITPPNHAGCHLVQTKYGDGYVVGFDNGRALVDLINSHRFIYRPVALSTTEIYIRQ